jgi:hypothetical protein
LSLRQGSLHRQAPPHRFERVLEFACWNYRGSFSASQAIASHRGLDK